MLGRRLIPLVHRSSLPPAIRTGICFPQRRLYAKDRKPGPKNQQYPSGPVARSKWPTAAAGQADHAKTNASQNKSVNQTYRGAASEVRASQQTSATEQGSRGHVFEDDRGRSHDETRSETPESVRLEQDIPNNETIPQQPLPDLTKGIPSTLDAELQQARNREAHANASLNITEDPSEPLPSSGGGGRGGDELPRTAYISSNERKKNALIKYTYLAVLGALAGGTVYLGRNWDSDEEAKKYPTAPSGWGLKLFYDRAKARMGSTMDYYNAPAFPKLLPDEEADPNLRAPFTLVLSLEDLLVHQEWSRESGWRIAKRPGVDYFIRYLSQYYELVLFTSQPSFIGDSVLRKLDPYRIIRWPLFREATLYRNGEYVKDISYLNRDLSKVILIDTVASHAKNQPENAIILPKWTGNPTDQTLVQMIPFLEYVATMGFDDARKVLKSFEGTYIPAEFAKREKILRDKFEARLAEERKSRPKRSVGAGLGSIFSGGGGSKPSGDQGIDTAALAEGEMLWDQIRKRGQKQYELIDRQIREEGQKWLDDMAAEEKKMQEESIEGMKGSVVGFFGLGGAGGGGGGGSAAGGGEKK